MTTQLIPVRKSKIGLQDSVNPKRHFEPAKHLPYQMSTFLQTENCNDKVHTFNMICYLMVNAKYLSLKG